MIKRILKVFLVLITLVVVFAVGFVLTLQVFEYRPADVTELSVDQNLENVNTNYVSLNQTIRVLTFNTGYASLSATEDFVMDGGVKARMDSQALVEANISGIQGILEDEQADIYLLQEVDVDSDRSYHTNQLATYSDALQMPVTLGYNYRVIFVPFPFEFGQMMGKVNSGIVSYFSYYVEDASRIQLPGSFPWPINLANLKRCIVVHHLPIDGSDKQFVVINVHLSAYDDGTMRVQEMEALKNIIQEEKDLGNYVLVGGDFNQTFPNAVNVIANADTVVYDYTYELKDPNFWQAFPMDGTWFEENGFSYVDDITTPTCRLLNQPYDTLNHDNNQYYVIDGFIVSDNIEVVSVQTVDADFQYSDHNPVRLEIRLIP